MKRILFGLGAFAAGIMALHFLSRWLQVRESTDCVGDARCLHEVQRGGETRSDREKAIGLAVLTGVCIWVAGSREP